MRLIHRAIAVLLILGPVGVRAEEADAQAGTELFRKAVYPVLKAKCLGCHGEGKDLEAGLDLRSRDKLLTGGDNGPAIVPGKPVDSLLYQAVLREGELAMPPKAKDRLLPNELAALRAWIEAGAPWAEPEPVKVSGGTWSYTDADTWAFRPVRRVAVPVLESDEPIRSPIDAFLLQKLNQAGLEPAPDADKRTLIRRLTFDLTGLPPTPEEINAFLADDRKDAYERLVDRLLASPRYGEQWGRHWLDVVRYADSDGFSNDYERPNAWRYRDYVIRSFNEDKPYDRFIVEQLAGDELAPDDPECQIAVGFLRMGPWEHTGMSVAAVTRQLFLDDVTHSTVTTFLGLTMGCARCHDHKFDPIPTRDYYRVQAVFAPVQFEERRTPFLPDEPTVGFEEGLAHLRDLIAKDQARLRELKAKSDKALKALLAEYDVKSADELPEAVRPKDNRLGLTDADLERERVYRKRLELNQRAVKRYQALAFSVSDGGLTKHVPTPQLAILVGGSLESPGQPVSPGVLSALAGSDDQQAPSAWNSIPGGDVGRRLALANWIASPTNPLTARVMVNRIWQYHFGKGLVETSNNFGKMGKRPTHPELLDWLAQWFVEHRWSVKAMHRLIVTSSAYRRSGTHPEMEQVQKADPEGKLLAYFPPRRLTAEELRDAMLAVSGELNLQAGGPPAFPELNRDVAEQPRQIMGTIAPLYQASARRAERHRRTVYTVQIRNLANPMLEVFNAADMNTSCERRDATTVAPQVFALFNSELAHDLALAMARRVETLADDEPGRVEQAFRLAFGRGPSAEERALAVQHLKAMTEHHERKPPPAREVLAAQVVRHHIGELSGAPFDFLEDRDISRFEPNLHPADVGPATRALAELCLVLLNSNEFLYID